MSDHRMKLIDTDTPKDRPILLGYSDYATIWVGRWSDAEQAFLPKCSPDNEHAATTWERADSWCELPRWGTQEGEEAA